MSSKWCRDTVIDKVKSLHHDGEDLSDKNIRNSHRLLRAAGVRYFGNWNQAIVAAGLDIELIAIRKKMERKRFN